ncbi:hypothetical protein [Devosia naphthalenivorans]|uniref:hypothetical protein n=1 Tax=Devosia naphthalenivorans TaxID=2082392 RepID=UPI0013B05980|nr:hypothetical protein [Devosia naphthalenivorans]
MNTATAITARPPPPLALIEARAELTLLLMYADQDVTIHRDNIVRVLSKLEALAPE